MDDYHEKFAQYYDVLYMDKNYAQECDFIERQIRQFGPRNAKTVLDVGCGTGVHAIEMARRGYTVTGVEPSPHMIEKAHEKNVGGKVTFMNGYVHDSPEQPYDVVMAVFNVVNCLEDREQMLSLFKAIRARMREESLFIFDCWNGLAALRERPETRFKKVSHHPYEIWRVAIPELDADQQVCELCYHILVLEEDRKIDEFESVHRIKFYTPEQIREMLADSKLHVVATNSFWDATRDAGEDAWIHSYAVQVRP